MRHKKLQLFIALIVLVIAGFAVVAFTVIGSPAQQRLRRIDNHRVEDLSQLQNQIVNYWQKEGALPEQLASLEEEYFRELPKDPLTDELYEYKPLGRLEFQLCATFALPSEENREYYGYPHYLAKGDNFSHEGGDQCFTWKIDEEEFERMKKDQLPVIERPPVVY